MPFKYICENCGSQVHPKKRFKEEKCRFCGSPIKPVYTCNKCGKTLTYEEILKYDNCPSCDEPIPKEKLKLGRSNKAMLENGKLTIDIAGGEFTSLGDIEQVSLNILGVEIGRIDNPDFAEFKSIDDYEETEDGVNLHFGSEEEEEFLEKIEKLKKSREKKSEEE